MEIAQRLQSAMQAERIPDVRKAGAEFLAAASETQSTSPSRTNQMETSCASRLLREGTQSTANPTDRASSTSITWEPTASRLETGLLILSDSVSSRLVFEN